MHCSYGFGSALVAANKFPFSVTLEGGDTLSFDAPPKVNGKKTEAMQYSHSVLALGFLAPYTVTFDDGQGKAYFTPGLSVL